MAKRKNGTSASPSMPPGEPPPSPEPTNGKGEGKKRPLVSFKCATDRSTWIDVAIWSQDVTYGNGEKSTQYVTSFHRSYRDGNGEFQTNYSYRQHDLPILQYLLTRAYAWIADQRVIEDAPVA